MAAVVVAAEHDAELRSAIAECRSKFGVRVGGALHWKEHVKSYSRRRFVADTLHRIPSVTINYVLFHKPGIPAGANLRQDQAAFYNYVAGLTLERILLTAQNWPGGERPSVVRFGHVRGFNHRETSAYFERKKRDSRLVKWQLLNGPPTFVHQNQLDGLQAADQYAGMMHAAITTDSLGYHEEHHLLRIKNQIRCDGNGIRWGYGLKLMGNPATLEGLPWWPQGGL